MSFPHSWHMHTYCFIWIERIDYSYLESGAWPWNIAAPEQFYILPFTHSSDIAHEHFMHIFVCKYPQLCITSRASAPSSRCIFIRVSEIDLLFVVYYAAEYSASSWIEKLWLLFEDISKQLNYDTKTESFKLLHWLRQTNACVSPQAARTDFHSGFTWDGCIQHQTSDVPIRRRFCLHTRCPWVINQMSLTHTGYSITSHASERGKFPRPFGRKSSRFKDSKAFE